ncbi:hypothetical protein EXIGLDRAFT_762279 [Exidia glandulosa HHB12029]|uniref:Uncharacterized protein n=1 Tax=Exidia glandulosa HHB12029 TaxID=1314781 RepID=A0A165MVB6_EXIGL|nr:hypothetical protein EXIGLDRAFT_762279 [Exidia glandulosa HHB12029]
MAGSIQMLLVIAIVKQTTLFQDIAKDDYTKLRHFLGDPQFFQGSPSAKPSPDASDIGGRPTTPLAPSDQPIPWSPSPERQLPLPSAAEKTVQETALHDTPRNSQPNNDDLQDGSSMSPSDESSSDDDTPTPPPPPRASRRAREIVWPTDKNIALANALYEHGPFNALYGGGKAAWTAVKQAMETQFDRSFSIDMLKKRAKELVADHEKSNNAAMRKSGVNKPLDTLSQVMEHVVQLKNDAATEKVHKSAKVQAKAKAEHEAGLQVQNTAASGCVDREELINIATLPSTTPRKKMAQRRKKKRARSVSSDSDKENAPSTSTKRRHHAEPDRLDDIAAVLMQQQEEDRKLLADANRQQAEAMRRQEEFFVQMQAFMQTSLARPARGGPADDAARRARRAEEKRRAEERRAERLEAEDRQHEHHRKLMVMMGGFFQTRSSRKI